MDYWHNRRIVETQLKTMQSNGKENKIVTRDHLYRFIYKLK